MIIEELKANVIAWMAGHGMSSRLIHFISKEEWAARKEGLGEDAELTALIEECELSWVFNSGEDGSVELAYSFTRLLRHAGFDWYLSYAWSLHFYRLETP